MDPAPSASNERGKRLTAGRTSGSGETPVRDYVFAALSFLITLVAFVSFFPVFSAAAGSFGTLGTTWAVSSFVAFWLAVWICLQTAWTWRFDRSNTA
jgi:hypothetical protein